MEVESIDEGTVAELLVADGTEDIKVGAVIARLTGEGEAAAPKAEAAPPPAPPAAAAAAPRGGEGTAAPAPPSPERGEGAGAPAETAPAASSPPAAASGAPADAPRVNASPLARRLAAAADLDLSTVSGSGPHGRIVKADVDAAVAAPRPAVPTPVAAAPPPRDDAAQAPTAPRDTTPSQTAQAAAHDTSRAAALPPPAGVPMAAVKLSNMRKTIARRLAESKATVPHFYLTVDVRLDALLKLRGDLNKSLEATGIKLSVNDLLIKALGLALVAGARRQRPVRRRRALQVRPRRHFGRRRHPRRPDHPRHRRRRQQAPERRSRAK